MDFERNFDFEKSNNTFQQSGVGKKFFVWENPVFIKIISV
jgi:hypothetical protein